MSSLAEKMAEENAKTMEAMFLDFFLPSICSLIKTNAPKREWLCQLIYSFTSAEPYTRLKVNKLVEEHMDDFNETLKCFAILVRFDSEYNDDLHGYLIA
jgi:hypothetical protein